MDRHELIIDEDFRDLVPDYLARRKTELETIGERVEESDFTYLKRLSHDWHGTGESYGIPFVSEIGEALNRAAKAEDKATILSLAEKLEQYLAHLDIRYE